MAFRSVETVAVLAFFLAFLSGCGGTGPRVVKVSGTVTRAGRPVDKLLVIYTPYEGNPSSGVTDKDGRYVLKYDRTHDGAITGKHKVWVKVRVMNPREEDELARGVLKVSPETRAILEKYGDDKSSPLAVEVKDNNQVIDLPLD